MNQIMFHSTERITSSESTEIHTRLRSLMVEAIQAYFSEDKHIFYFEEPLVLVETEDDNYIFYAISKESCYSVHELDVADTPGDETKWDQVESRHMIWALEQLETDAGQWDLIPQ